MITECLSNWCWHVNRFLINRKVNTILSVKSTSFAMITSSFGRMCCADCWLRCCRSNICSVRAATAAATEGRAPLRASSIYNPTIRIVSMTVSSLMCCARRGLLAHSHSRKPGPTLPMLSYCKKIYECKRKEKYPVSTWQMRNFLMQSNTKGV